MSKISDTLNTPVAANTQGTRRKLTDQTVIYTDNTEADTGNWKPPARDKREGL